MKSTSYKPQVTKETDYSLYVLWQTSHL